MSPAAPAGLGHVPVLLKEAMEALEPRAGGLYVDGTFGAGGYARALLDCGARVIALDRDHSAIRADICRDPSRDDRRRAHEPSSPDRRYSAICRPIPRRLEYDPRTLDASYDVIGDRRTWTHRAAEEHPGEIPRGVHCQDLQQGATLALPNRGDEALGRSRNSGCDKKKQSGDDAIHALLQVGLAAIGRQRLNDRSQLSRQAPNLHFEASLEPGIFSMRRA
jgi:hypothetical protein